MGKTDKIPFFLKMCRVIGVIFMEYFNLFLQFYLSIVFCLFSCFGVFFFLVEKDQHHIQNVSKTKTFHFLFMEAHWILFHSI